MPAPDGLRAAASTCPRGSSQALLLEGKANLLRLRQEIPPNEAEPTAMEEGSAAHNERVAKLADIPAPDGTTPRQVGGSWSMSAATAMRLVPEDQVPRALGLLNGGNALAATVAARARVPLLDKQRGKEQHMTNQDGSYAGKAAFMAGAAIFRARAFVSTARLCSRQ